MNYLRMNEYVSAKTPAAAALSAADAEILTLSSGGLNGGGSGGRYRFYHCYQKPVSIVCYPVDNEHTLPSKPDSRLLFVPKYLPEILDTLFLNYKYYKSVNIKQCPVDRSL
jgi:hypothetical protein